MRVSKIDVTYSVTTPIVTFLKMISDPILEHVVPRTRAVIAHWPLSEEVELPLDSSLSGMLFGPGWHKPYLCRSVTITNKPCSSLRLGCHFIVFTPCLSSYIEIVPYFHYKLETPFSYFMQIWQLFNILSQPCSILNT